MVLEAKTFGEKLVAWRRWRKTLRLERYLLARVASTVVVAERDAELLHDDNPSAAIHVIHNGVDCGYFKPVAHHGSGKTIVFSGNMSYYPNIKTAQVLANSVFPAIRRAVPGAQLLVVGASPSPEVEELRKLRGVTVTGFVEDIREYLAKGDVYICPMHIGTGIKNKLLEAMAMGLPVISTPEACSGLDVTDNKNVLFARNEGEFVDLAVALLNDRERASSLGSSGRRLVEDRYSWDASVSKYERLLESVVKKEF